MEYSIFKAELQNARDDKKAEVKAAEKKAIVDAKKVSKLSTAK